MLAWANEADAIPQTKPEIVAFAERVFTIADLVLDQHVDPPTRQQMLLAGIKAMTGATRGAPELARRVSEIRDAQEFSRLLAEIWQEPDVAKIWSGEVENSFVEGMFGAVPGRAILRTANDVRVDGQLAGNRYVGVGIAIGLDKESGLPQINSVVAGGPAEKAGIKKDDLIEQIDDTVLRKKSTILDYISRTRGAEGSRVTFHVRQPNSEELRSVDMIRSPIDLGPTLGKSEIPKEIRPPIGYVKITQIGGSTVHELRVREAELRKNGVQALILDLRGGDGGGHAPAAMMLADSLVAGKPLAKLRTRSGTRVFTGDDDCLFRDWPIAVLIDEQTSGAAEWVAGALQDAAESGANSRIVLIGSGTAGRRWVRDSVFLPGGDEALVMVTGVMERVRGPNSSKIVTRSHQPRIRAAAEESAGPPVFPDVPVTLTDPAQRDPKNPAVRSKAGTSTLPGAIVKPHPVAAPAAPDEDDDLSDSAAAEGDEKPSGAPVRVGNPVTIAIQLLTMKLQKRDQASKE